MKDTGLEPEEIMELIQLRNILNFPYEGRYVCEWCGSYKSPEIPYSGRIMHCEKCGKPITEEAYEEIERRIKWNNMSRTADDYQKG